MEQEIKVFAIIVTYNGRQWSEKCFSSIRESHIPINTIVVDNNSSDGTVDFIRSRFPEVILIESPTNLGFGKANNIGLRYALEHECDYVFLLNQDTWIKPDTLSIMLPIAESHKECGLFSPMHLASDEKSLYIEIEDGMTDHANDLLSDCYCHSLQDIYLFKYVNAAAWLMPRETLKTIGGFDPLFFVYGEDDNYLQRLEYHGKRVGLIPKAVIIHDHQEGKNNTSSSYIEYRRQQTKLVNYLNIMQDVSINAQIRYRIRKSFVSLLFFKKSEFKRFYTELVYLIKNRKALDNSRKTNVQLGPSWL